MIQAKAALFGAGVVGLVVLAGVAPANASTGATASTVKTAPDGVVSQALDSALTPTSPNEGDTVGVRPTMTGTAFPGSYVNIGYRDTGGNSHLWMALVADDGTWSFTFPDDLPEGPVDLLVDGYDASPSAPGTRIQSLPLRRVLVSSAVADSPMFAAPVAAGGFAAAGGLGLATLLVRRRRSADAVAGA